LDGFTTVARVWVGTQPYSGQGPDENGPFVKISPNAQYITYETDATLGSDVDPLPDARNLYELDRSTGVNHLISPGGASALDVRDDGAVLVSYDAGFSSLGIYTIDGGVVPFARPTSPPLGSVYVQSGLFHFETGGTGIDMLTDGSDTQPGGLYRFDAGDVTATPVATVPPGTVVPDPYPTIRPTVMSVSPNHRYIELRNSGGVHYVDDTVTATLLPNSLQEDAGLLTLTGTVWNRANQPVTDDGLLLVFSQSSLGGVYTGGHMAWFNPADGTRTVIAGLNDVGTDQGWPYQGSTVYGGADFSSSVGTQFKFLLKPGIPVLVELAPFHKWGLPAGSGVLGVGPNGDVVLVGPTTTEPGDTSAGADILVREGPLP
jgi:hypothetical protein